MAIPTPRPVVDAGDAELARDVASSDAYREGQWAEFRHQLLDPAEPPEAVAE
jgi:hypothetical protein